MIDQEKRDKIIDDLQLCRCEMEYCNKDECSYFLKECLKDLHDEAIAMLRAVPRAMRLEEVATLPEGSVVWLEDNDKQDVITGMLRDVYITAKEDTTVVVLFHFVVIRGSLVEIVTAMAEDYGIRWRCWTSSPTDAQREEVKWR